ncbi:hypothetical protein BHECKSOX_2342 [Bathymodiolus heckerae thiotrophic gill symbiont]|uniref:hypothetical protein n=1 Tax=Bathymodiolus heckerae thiotrophic gill symbiont TaxID=1052212 RepID=UPI0010B5638B
MVIPFLFFQKHVTFYSLYERGYCKAIAVIIRDVEKSCANGRLCNRLTVNFCPALDGKPR